MESESGMPSFVFILCVLALLATSLFATKSQFRAESMQPKKHVAFFVFGDSSYDPGNNNFINVSNEDKGNYPPYGETFFSFPTGRRSDGRLISDFIAMYANLPMWKPYLEPAEMLFINGSNFASAGACVLPENHEGEICDCLNLDVQLSLFQEMVNLLREQLGDAAAAKVLNDAVYMFSFGGVDYWIFESKYPNATEAMKSEYVQLVVGNITAVVKEIYEIGGRKFVFQNVEPIGCWPKVKQEYNLSSHECLESLLELPRLHRDALYNATQELEMQLSGFKYSVFDYFNALYETINNPLKHGFEVADVACCGNGIYHADSCGIVAEYNLCTNPNKYVFFDGVHPTEHVYSQMAELLWNGGSNVTSPINLKKLIDLDSDDQINNFLKYDAAYSYI